MYRIRDVLTVLAIWLMAACGTGAPVVEIRIHNASTLDFTAVTVAGRSYGDIAAGATSDYQPVRSRLGYVLVELTADGQRVNAQTLNLRAKRFTHRIAIKDLGAGHLAVEIVRD